MFLRGSHWQVDEALVCRLGVLESAVTTVAFSPDLVAQQDP